METSKRHLPFSGHEEPRELKRTATSQSDYSVASLDSTDRTRNANGGDWQEEVHQKIKAMKELYLHDLNDMHRKLVGKLQQYDSIPQQPKNEQLENMKVFKNLLKRFMAFLQIPKQSIMASYKDKLSTYEKQIVHIINSNRRKPGAPQQNNTGNMQQNSVKVSSLQGSSNPQQNMMNSMQPSSNLEQVQNSGMNSLQGGSLQQTAVSGAQQVNKRYCILNYTDEPRNANGGDWQEEVYQKIKAMKELYLHDLDDMHHKLVGKLQQYDSIPQQPENEQLEKMKVFKNLLERFMAFLQIPKQSILASYKDKLGTYEKQIVHFINSNRRKPGAPQQR